jgi:fatty acid-binding protein DegV
MPKYEEPYVNQGSAASPIHAVTMQQVVDWTGQGLSADEIISRIRATQTTFSLTAEDVSYLQRLGVSQRVIEAMQAAG